MAQRIRDTDCIWTPTSPRSFPSNRKSLGKVAICVRKPARRGIERLVDEGEQAADALAERLE
jgi:hypothetical protein